MDKRFFAGLVAGMLGGLGGAQLLTTVEASAEPTLRVETACAFPAAECEGGYGIEVRGQLFANATATEPLRPWGRSGCSIPENVARYVEMGKAWASARRQGGPVGTPTRICLFPAQGEPGGFGVELWDEYGQESGPAPVLPDEFGPLLSGFALEVPDAGEPPPPVAP